MTEDLERLLFPTPLPDMDLLLPLLLVLIAAASFMFGYVVAKWSEIE